MLHHEGTKDTKVTKACTLAASHEVIGAAIEVHRLLGPGLLESVYEVALCKELRLRGITVDRQISIPVNYKGEALDCYMKLDLLVEHSIIVEVKSVDKLIPVHKARLLTYLRLQDLWLGLLNISTLSHYGMECGASLMGKDVLRVLRDLRAFVVK